VNVDELRQAIRAGEVERVAELLVAANEKERRAAAKSVGAQADLWRWDRNERHLRRQQAAVLAWAGTATAREISSGAWALVRLDDQLDDAVYTVLAARGRGFMENLARMLLRERSFGWPLVRRAAREGVIARPEHPNFVGGMIFWVGTRNGHNAPDSVYRGLVDEPEYLDDVWELFEHDFGTDLGMWGQEDNRWRTALVRLAAEGRLDRERLLDASLDALMRDFRPSGLAWYAQLHEALEPTREERAARLDRYLALVASPAPPAVKAGLAGLKALDDGVSAEELARAAPAALAQPQKTQALEVLRLLERAAKRDEVGRPVLLAAAANALGHERTDVQERAVKLIERYPEDAPRAELLAYVDAVAPTLRSRVEELTGMATGPEPVAAPPLEELGAEAAVFVRERRWPEPRLPQPAPVRPLEPIESVDELIELSAALLEGQGSGDDAERFLDGVSRLCAERPPRFTERTAGIVKQAGQIGPWELRRGRGMVACVVRAWARRQYRRERENAWTMIGGLLAARTLEVSERAASQIARPLLSTPTHEGGWLDRETLVERAQRTGRIFNRAGQADYAVAGFRTLAGPPISLMPDRTVGPPQTAGVSYRVGIRIDSLPSELAHQTAIIWPLQQLGRYEAVSWYLEEDPVWPVGDALGASWLCTLLPGYPEIQFARALTAIADCIDGTVYRHPEVVLEQMLDPDVPLRDPAWTAVAAALLAKSPDLQRLAADVVVATVSDGRFDAVRLGAGLGWLLDGGFGTITRIEAPLRDAARVSPLHAAQILRALEVLVVASPEDRRRLHAPLGLALELAAGARTGLIEPAAGGAVERLAESASRSSKLGKSARGLLELQRNDGAYDAILRLAASAAA
jgi:hypothetical protein